MPVDFSILKEVVNYTKYIGIAGNRLRYAIMSKYSKEHIPDRYNEDTSSNDPSKLSKYASRKKEKFENRYPKTDAALRVAYGGLKRVINVATSPMASRILYVGGTAVGIAFLSSNPVTLGIAIGGATIAGGLTAYRMARDVRRFRKLKRLQREQALLEENLKLSVECDALGKLIGFEDEGIKRLTALPQPTGAAREWKKHSKLKTAGLTFAEQAPESLYPIVLNAATLNWVGLGCSIAGHFLEACGRTTRMVAYHNQRDELLNRNASLADNLGIRAISHGKRNEDLALKLTEIRARRQALIIIQKEIEAGRLDKNDQEALNTKFLQYYNRELNHNEGHKAEYKEESIWKDARTVLIQNGFSYEKSKELFQPANNQFRDEYKTHTVQAPEQTTKKEREQEELEQNKLIIRESKILHATAATQSGNIIFSDEMKEAVSNLATRYNNPQFTRISLLIHQRSKGAEIQHNCDKFMKELLKDVNRYDDLSNKEKEALNLVGKIESVVVRSKGYQAARSA